MGTYTRTPGVKLQQFHPRILQNLLIGNRSFPFPQIRHLVRSRSLRPLKTLAFSFFAIFFFPILKKRKRLDEILFLYFKSSPKIIYGEKQLKKQRSPKAELYLHVTDETFNRRFSAKSRSGSFRRADPREPFSGRRIRFSSPRELRGAERARGRRRGINETGPGAGADAINKRPRPGPHSTLQSTYCTLYCTVSRAERSTGYETSRVRGMREGVDLQLGSDTLTKAANFLQPVICATVLDSLCGTESVHDLLHDSPSPRRYTLQLWLQIH